jgi:SARP family transcriptional regulator, regulator of embCAB operon
MLELDGRALGPDDLGGRKPKQVLEILLVHLGQAVPKDRVADLLWGDRLPKDPMRTLEAYVSGIRARLHPDPAVARRVLHSEPGAYRIALDAAEVDLRRFDALVAQAVAAEPGERLELRRGVGGRAVRELGRSPAEPVRRAASATAPGRC